MFLWEMTLGLTETFSSETEIDTRKIMLSDSIRKKASSTEPVHFDRFTKSRVCCYSKARMSTIGFLRCFNGSDGCLNIL